LCEDAGDLAVDLVVDLAQQRQVAVLFAVKEFVEGLVPDVRGLADLLDRGVGVTVNCDEVQRGFQQLRTALLGV
jgi:hypothetical protein